MNYFEGFARPDGSYGTRNHVVVMASVVCANGVGGGNSASGSRG